MTYASQQNLEDRFGSDELLQLAPNAAGDAIDTDRVATALQDADALIDSYISVRVSVPVDPVPDVLVRIAADLARASLHDDHAPEEVESRRKSAIQWLRDAAAGKAAITSDDAGAEISGRVVTRQGKSNIDWRAHDLCGGGCV